jgi:hypothetical protein
LPTPCAFSRRTATASSLWMSADNSCADAISSSSSSSLDSTGELSPAEREIHSSVNAPFESDLRPSSGGKRQARLRMALETTRPKLLPSIWTPNRQRPAPGIKLGSNKVIGRV